MDGLRTPGLAPSSDPARPAGPRAAVVAPQAPVGSAAMRQVTATRRMLGESWCRWGWLLPSRVSAQTAETPRRGQAGDTARTPAKPTSLTTSTTVMARGGAWPQPPPSRPQPLTHPAPGPHRLPQGAHPHRHPCYPFTSRPLVLCTRPLVWDRTGALSNGGWDAAFF